MNLHDLLSAGKILEEIEATVVALVANGGTVPYHFTVTLHGHRVIFAGTATLADAVPHPAPAP